MGSKEIEIFINCYFLKHELIAKVINYDIFDIIDVEMNNENYYNKILKFRYEINWKNC